MKIGIVTLYFPGQWDNYGGILQNIALARTLESLGNEVDTLGFVNYKAILGPYKKLLNFLYKKYGIAINPRRLIIKQIGIQKQRNDIFWNFVYENLNLKEYWTSENFDYSKIDSSYDIFFVGSDQVWNPIWAVDEKTCNHFFLKFTTTKKKYAYAASFGASCIPDDKKTIFRAGLQGFNKISVREVDAVRIVKDISGKNAVHVLDPTLIVPSEEWEKIKKRPSWLSDQEYVLEYFLGDKIAEVEKQKEGIFDKEIRHIKLMDKNDKNAFLTNPAEFVYLISNASLILTDSFHAVVFSFLYGKPFLVFDRTSKEGDMSSRLISLLKQFKLERKYANSGLDNDIWEHDYTEGYKQLEIERKKSMIFLKEALED